MNKKYLLIADLILILGSLISVFFVVGYTQPLAIAPLKESGSLMFTLPKVDYLLIDEDIKFGSPVALFIGENLNLVPGRYYVKIDSNESIEIREIKAETDISLQLNKIDSNSVGVFNVGKNVLKVETYKVGTLINSSRVYVDISSANGGNGQWKE